MQIKVKFIKGKNEGTTKTSLEYLQNVNCSSIKQESYVKHLELSVQLSQIHVTKNVENH